MTEEVSRSPVGHPRQRKLKASKEIVESLPRLYREAAFILVQNGDIELTDDVVSQPERGSA
jgi:hypothetical protein